MPFKNIEIAGQFEEIADLLEIQGANPFRVRAYRNAARVIANWPVSLAALVISGSGVPKLPGIGSDLSGKITEIAKTGKFKALEGIKRSIPRGLIELLKIPGLGPKRVNNLRNVLKVKDLEDLKRAVDQGRIRDLRGFGPKIEEQIRRRLQEKDKGERQRIRWSTAEQIVKPLMDELKKVEGIDNIVAAGSYRRATETVGDIDLLVSCPKSCSGQVMDRFVKYEDVEQVVSKGATRSSVIIRSTVPVQVDLRVIPIKSYGAALHYFTGSKTHNIAIRALGVRKGLKINEYGVFRGKKRIGGTIEEDVFKAVGLPYIDPELRENRGEIEAARKRQLPKLVELKDIRGDLHVHTNATDGRLTLIQMVQSAQRHGYEYVAITDHSRHLTVAKGLSVKALRQEIAKIDGLNDNLKGFRVLKSIEVDILEDGTLDLPDEVIKDLDFTVCSVHYKFNLSEEKQTERVIRAMDNRYFTILGHPTGRLINLRKPYEIDLEKIFQAASERGCFLELNAQPERLDLNDVYARRAKEFGLKLAISTDAHSDYEMNYMRFGVNQAKRGWLGADDIINTRPLDELLKILRGTRVAPILI